MPLSRIEVLVEEVSMETVLRIMVPRMVGPVVLQLSTIFRQASVASQFATTTTSTSTHFRTRLAGTRGS